MSQLNTKNVVSEIVKKVRFEAPKAFAGCNVEAISEETATKLAKDLGYMEAVRGPGGGLSPTDLGLTFAGFNAEEYHAEQEKLQAKNSLERKIANLLKKKEELEAGAVASPAEVNSEMVPA